MSPHQVKSNRAHDAGFTLVEALVSLVLLTVALVPTFILAADAIKMSVGIRNSLIAANLAQEGVEIVRAMRDTNWFNGVPFTSGLDACIGNEGCRVQWDTTTPQPLVGNPPLKLDRDTGLYQYSASLDSPFSRMITMQQGTTPSELVVRSEVTWVERTVPKKIIVESHLFDWLQL